MRSLMSRWAGLLFGAVVVMAAAAEARADERAIIFNFTPTERAQIAIWIEKADGTFLSTVGLTQATAVRGIGNRPGATQMNSGYHWPYGRREGVLPVWAHRRLSAPGTAAFPRIIFQKRPEGYASRTCEDSTRDMYFCLSFTAESTRKEGLDAVSCASAFNSDKGRIMLDADVANGYTEPAAVGGAQTDRRLSLTSPYPPRRDFVSCADASTVNSCMGGSAACLDHPDSATFSTAARAAMPEIDAVTMATPPANVEQTVMYSVPASWLDGDYVAYVEVNTEGDYNGTFSTSLYPTPQSTDWDSWAMSYGYPYRGQPSVVYSVPFTLGPAGLYSTMTPVGFGSVDGTDANPGAMHAMDGSITDDPQLHPGSGADRLRLSSTQTSRLEVEVRPCLQQAPPDAPTEFTVEPVVDPKRSHQWGHLRFVVPPSASRFPIERYEVRTSSDGPIVPGDAESFIRGIPGQAATDHGQGLLIPAGGAAGTTVEVDFGGLVPSTHYWVGIRAVDNCNRAGPHAVAELDTTRINFTQLPKFNPFKGDCFIATAAWGSALEPTVGAMRRARDQLLAEVPLFAVAADLYGRSGPVAASVLRRSDTARVLARRMLGPLASTAEVLMPTN
jgi:hypothetical protein